MFNDREPRTLATDTAPVGHGPTVAGAVVRAASGSVGGKHV